jgi:hypothetical protein
MTQLCVIFDIDGTLCDTNAVDDECYRRAAAAVLDLPTSQIDWTDAPHITDSGIARWLWERLRGRAPTPQGPWATTGESLGFCGRSQRVSRRSMRSLASPNLKSQWSVQAQIHLTLNNVRAGRKSASLRLRSVLGR